MKRTNDDIGTHGALHSKNINGGNDMWDHYRRTFAKMQIFIWLAAGGVFYALGRRFLVAIVFFAMMQVGAVVGAWWGERLRRRLRVQTF